MEERSMRKKPVVLMILDGYGLNDKVEGNAVAQANTPVMDSLMKEYPFVHGNASGMAVGLPEGQMGNSEVGHMNMGAGRIVYQELTRITKEIKDGDFFKNSGPAFSGSGAALDIVCRRLGGIHQPKGDVSYELALFPFLPLILRFWEADEEFPASLQALVDRNTLDFLRYETLMFALDYVVKRLNTLCAEMTNI